MKDLRRKERIFLLLKIWFYLQEKGLVWSEVSSWLEHQINEEFKQ